MEGKVFDGGWDDDDSDFDFCFLVPEEGRFCFAPKVGVGDRKRRKHTRKIENVRLKRIAFILA